MIAASFKTVIVGAVFLFAAPQNLDKRIDITPADITCGNTLPASYTRADWHSLTRRDLELMGKKGDSLGLYYLAQKDLKNGYENDAIEKLELSAAKGLADAYRQLANIYATRGKFKKEKLASYCLSKLIRMETLISD